MIKTLCALRNTETGLMCDPFISINANQAMTRFTYACTIDYQSDIFHEVEKYDLYLLGQFDDVTGEIISEFQKLISGLSLVEKRNESRDKYYSQQIINKLDGSLEVPQ